MKMERHDKVALISVVIGALAYGIFVYLVLIISRILECVK